MPLSGSSPACSYIYPFCDSVRHTCIIKACIWVLGIQDICHFTSRDIGYYPFYFQGYRILCSMFLLLSGIFNIQEVNYGDIWRFIRDTCLFTSTNMGYLVTPPPPIKASLLAFLRKKYQILRS